MKLAEVTTKQDTMIHSASRGFGVVVEECWAPSKQKTDISDVDHSTLVECFTFQNITGEMKFDYMIIYEMVA